MIVGQRLLSAGLGAIQMVLLCCIWGTQAGCRNENRFQDLHLSTVEDSPNLPQLRTQVSFRAELVEINIITETNAVSGQGATNFYQFVLRDEHGRERVFAGVNASGNDLESLRSLKKARMYTFPDALKKHKP